MNKIIKTIQNQVVSCKKLLKVFQDERQVYNIKKNVGIKEVKIILARKKQIVTAFEAQHTVLKELRSSEVHSGDREQKDTLRELGSILEQLLVIDHENEKLLRKILSVQPSKTTNTRALTPVSSARPSLQRQLPFVPGAPSAPSVTATRPLVGTQAAPRTASRLRSYSGSAQRQRLDSKYA